MFDLRESVFPIIVSNRDASNERQREISLNAERCRTAQRHFLRQAIAGAIRPAQTPSDVTLWPEMESARIASRLPGPIAGPDVHFDKGLSPKSLEAIRSEFR